MADLQTAHTADLTPAELRKIRTLLADVFGDELTDDDVEHALGGIHALVWEGVAVRADRRREGHGASVMGAVERIIGGAYELGALAATDEAVAFYTARGWRRWTGTASVLAPDGIRRTPGDEGGIYVLPVTAELAPDGDLACDWRNGDVW